MNTIEIDLERADSEAATALVNELEDHLASRYPAESRHGLSVERLLREGVHFFVSRVDGNPAGCGGIKLFGKDYGELKRMYVRPQFRGHGLGRKMLSRLEDLAREHGINTVRLETGVDQTEAIAMYERAGYERIPPFGDYFEDPLSLCYEKRLT